jgi:glycosyltransferase involved in cell wall biosynthesis
MAMTQTLRPDVSVIIPARNEEANLGYCLQSLVTQTGLDFEIIVVDDHSTDRTHEIAASFSGVCVIEAGPPPPGWTGKNNAVATGARQARGEWLLFTDADTVHVPNSLARALSEAKQHGCDLLSYSPEQIAVTFWEMAILPVVFAELARQYPPAKVSDPNSPEAAANGQYILIKRDVYDAVGGHTAIADKILEDVSLARAVKSSGHAIRFRYAADAVRTRMYRNFRQLREGWTKNLALLFPNPGWLAVRILVWWALPWVLFSPIVFRSGIARHWWWNSLLTFGILRNTLRLRRANCDFIMEVFGATCGMPMFAYLLLRSKRAHDKGAVSWKGRTYEGEPSSTEDTAARNPTVIKKTLMKTLFILLLPTILLAAAAISTQPSLAAIAPQSITESPRFTKTMIEPGLGVGPIKLGDTRDHALELFPKKAEDQEWDDPCGSTIDWVDTTNPIGRGDLLIRHKKGKIFQIESSSTRFQTAEGITIFDSPEKVANAYREMRAWALLNPPSPALGSRPLVFWIDRKRGISFVLAYDPSHHKRYVYKIIVFEPNKDICPELEKVSSPKWQSIRPYATEPPIELSPESQ